MGADTGVGGPFAGALTPRSAEVVRLGAACARGEVAASQLAQAIAAFGLAGRIPRDQVPAAQTRMRGREERSLLGGNCGVCQASCVALSCGLARKRREDVFFFD